MEGLEFPCEFPFKIISETSDNLLDDLKEIFFQHAPGKVDFKARPSKGGNYISYTATFTAQNQAQLDNLYRDLGKHPKIKMVL